MYEFLRYISYEFAFIYFGLIIFYSMGVTGVFYEKIKANANKRITQLLLIIIFLTLLAKEPGLNELYLSIIALTLLVVVCLMICVDNYFGRNFVIVFILAMIAASILYFIAGDQKKLISKMTSLALGSALLIKYVVIKKNRGIR